MAGSESPAEEDGVYTLPNPGHSEMAVQRDHRGAKLSGRPGSLIQVEGGFCLGKRREVQQCVGSSREFQPDAAITVSDLYKYPALIGGILNMNDTSQYHIGMSTGQLIGIVKFAAGGGGSLVFL